MSKYRSELTEHFCHLLSFATPNGENDRCPYRYLYAYRLDTGLTFQDIRLPAVFPFVLLQRAELLEGDLDDLRHLLSEHFRHRFALLVLFSDELGLGRARRMLDEKLRKVYAYDVIALGREDFQQIIVKKDPQRALQQLVLRNVDLITVSPFVTSGPVPDNMFFGREQELREITEHAGTTSYALVGGRRVGKTSILQRLDRVRLPAVGYSTLYFDCQPYPTSEEFLRVAYQRWMNEQLPGDSAPPPFTEIVDRFAGDGPLAILLDEIDRLAMNDAAEGSPLFSTFRALSQSGQCQFVICGERALRSKLRDADSPLFNFCNEMLIGMLDYQAVEELVTKPFKQLEIELVNEHELVQRIYDFSSGHPNVVQRLCQRLVEQLNEKQTRRLTVEDVGAVVSDPKFQRDSRDTFWERATVLEKLISLVMVEDQSCRSVDDVHQALARHGVQASFRQVDGALERLVDLRSILHRTPSGYEFVVTAFPRMLSQTTTIHNAIEYQKEVFEEIGDEVEI
ncbi:MAG: AAA family ATPase [Anaerolineales bacterium]|nr:MAG: AAA family ATPase [Anaerolineales bacterium]